MKFTQIRIESAVRDSAREAAAKISRATGVLMTMEQFVKKAIEAAVRIAMGKEDPKS